MFDPSFSCAKRFLLFSETTEIHGYSFIDDNITYTLIDTPGFDDTYESDEAIAIKISQWLASSYQRDKKETLGWQDVGILVHATGS